MIRSVRRFVLPILCVALLVGGTLAQLAVSATPASAATPLSSFNVSSSDTTSSFGQNLNFNISLTGPSGAPTGTVDVLDGSTTICTETLGAAGSVAFASCSVDSLEVGNHPITATYSGDGTYDPEVSTAFNAAISQDVAQSQTTTGVDSSVNPSALGENITFDATVAAVAPGGGTPDGSVDFRADDDIITGCSGVPLVSGVANCQTATLSLGDHSIVADYTGATGYAVSNSPGQTQTVTAIPTTTALTSDVNPSEWNGPIIFTASVSPDLGSSTPTGDVAFRAGSSDISGCSARTLVGGTITCTTSSLAVGNSSITAVYAGDLTHATSTSTPLSQDVDLATTATALTSSVNPSVSGQPVVFTATVTSAGGTPDGVIEFQAGSTTITGCDARPLVAGTVTCSTSALAVGAPTITASYSGSDNFDGSMDALTQTVNQADVTNVLTSDDLSAVFSQSVTLTATLSATAPATGTPTGTVSFGELGTPIASCGARPIVAGVATCTISTLSVTTHTLDAEYSGDASFNTTPSNTIAEVVAKAHSSAAVTSSDTTTASSEAVTFTVTLTPEDPATVAPNGGTATFFLDGDPISGCATQTVNAGEATCTTSIVAVGLHSISADYSGYADFVATDSPAIDQTVGLADTTTVVTSGDTTTTFSESVTFTATVSPVNPATATPAAGTVNFRSGVSSIAGCAAKPVSTGVATCTTSALVAGSPSITAVYSGDAAFNPSTSTGITQTVAKASVTVALVTSDATTSYTEPVTFTATITPVAPATAAPTSGTVNFNLFAGSIPTCTAQPVNGSGVATCTTTVVPVGEQLLAAVFSGTANHSAASSPLITQTVSAAATSTAVTSSDTTTTWNDPVTFTATVSPTTPATVAPSSGTAAFFSDAGPITGCATATVTAGIATCDTSTLPIGGHSITAVYSGDSSYLTSTSPGMTQTVGKASSTTTVTSSDLTTTSGESVTFTATVSPVSPASTTPTGTVTFTSDAGTISGCSAQSLTVGAATCATSTLAVGDHSITAEYNGDTSYEVSTASAITQTVGKAASTTALTSSDLTTLFSEPVTFTATISPVLPATATPASGTVDFTLDGTSITGCETQSVTAGAATCSSSEIPVGTQTIGAVYTGDTTYTGSTALDLNQEVALADSTTTVASSDLTTVFSEGITFTATMSPVSPATATPAGGTVTFKSGGSTISGCATQAVTAGTATCSSDTFDPGSTSVTAVYNGDTSFNPSTSSGITQTVAKADTTNVLTSSDTTTVFSESVTFTATVDEVLPATLTPASGTVTFKLGGTTITACAARPTSGGIATCTSTTIPVGANSMTAVYNGDGAFNPSTASAVTQTVAKADATATVSSSDSSTAFSEPVTFTATLEPSAPATATPASGTVAFTIGGDPITACAAQAVTAGVATCTTSLVPTGSQSIRAQYSGDDSFNAVLSPIFTQSVDLADTATVVTSSDPTTVFSEPVTFTATIAPVVPGTATPDDGTVSFSVDGTPVSTCETQPVNTGVATCTTSVVPVGTPDITATYTGDDDFDPSTAEPITQTVAKADTTTDVSSSDASTVYSEPITFTATIDPVSPATATPDAGTVTFEADGIAITECTELTISAGEATCTTSTIAVGDRDITAVSNGDDSYNSSTSELIDQVVSKADTTMVVATSDASTVYTEPVTFTATISPVSPATAPPAGGTVNFNFFGSSFASCTAQPVTAGVATCTSSTVPVGSHLLATVFSGDSSFNSTSSSLVAQTVAKAATSTVTTSSDDVSSWSQDVTFTATVTPTAPATIAPSTGTVSFTADGDPITGCATQPVGGGIATCSTSTLTIGAHTIVTSYTGDAGYLTSTATDFTQTVGQAASTTVLTSAPNPSVWSQSATLTATVSPTAPATTTPTGTVTFKAGGTDITACSAKTLTAGVATCATSTIPVGTSSLTAVYNGDTSYSTSTSPAVSHIVTKAATTTTVTSGANPSVFSAPVTFTATIATTTPGTAVTSAGTVAFKYDATTITGCATQAVSAGVATCTSSTVPAGTRSITAVYSGSTSFATSTATGVLLSVNMATTTTAVTTSDSQTEYSTPITFTATITTAAPATAVASAGTVAFKYGTTTITGCATVAVVSGVATCVTGTVPVGSQSITAAYSGDASFAASTSPAVTQTVNKIPTAINVTSNANPARFGQSVTLTATVSSTTGTPTGEVAFFQLRSGGGRVLLGTSQLVSGVATMTSASLSLGTTTISTVYRGSTTMTTANTTTTQTVTRGASSVALVSSLTPSVTGQAVTFTATIAAVSPSAGTPNGQVAFYRVLSDSSRVWLGMVVSSGGTSSFTTSAIPVGTQSIIAVYRGEAGYSPSNGSTMQTVTAPH